MDSVKVRHAISACFSPSVDSADGADLIVHIVHSFLSFTMSRRLRDDMTYSVPLSLLQVPQVPIGLFLCCYEAQRRSVNEVTHCYKSDALIRAHPACMVT